MGVGGVLVGVNSQIIGFPCQSGLGPLVATLTDW